MSLAIGRFPALASHTLLFILGISASRSWLSPAPPPAKVSGPGPGQALISLPASLSHNQQWKSTPKGTALSLVKIRRSTGKASCLCSPVLLRQATAKGRWQVLVQTKDISEMYRCLNHKSYTCKIGPASKYSMLNFCETPDREVIYGAFL